MSKLVTMAREMVEACEREDWDEAYANADPKFVKGFTEFMIAETWSRVRTVAGRFVQVVKVYELRYLLAPVRAVFLVCKFERQLVTVEVSFGDADTILGLALLTPGFGERMK